MKVLMVGLNHQIQRSEILSGGDEIVRLERAQKEHFGKSLARFIQNGNVKFVGEEGQHGVELIAEKVARQLECGHVNIEMPPDERKTRGIPTDYIREDRDYSREQRAAWHKERERYMFDQVIKRAACDSVVVLCGREHLEGLSILFKEAGHEVQTYDLNREPWYIEDWLKHVLTS